MNEANADNVATFINYGGQTIALCLAQPNRRTRPQLSLEFPADITWHPLSKRQSARIFAHSARYQMQYLVTLRSSPVCTAFEMWLQKLQTETVAVPLWAD